MSSPNTCEAPIARRQGKGAEKLLQTHRIREGTSSLVPQSAEKIRASAPEVKARIELFGNQ